MIQETCASHVAIIYSLEVINWSNSTHVAQATKGQEDTVTAMTSGKQMTLNTHLK